MKILMYNAAIGATMEIRNYDVLKVLMDESFGFAFWQS
jgi:hypothetical protein